MKFVPSFCSGLALLAIVHAACTASAQHIGAGGYHSLALCSDGTLQAWGNGSSGELGNGDYTSMDHPVAVSTLTTMVAVASGLGAHSLAVKSDGSLWAWGNNGAGQLGDGGTTGSPLPVQVSGLG
ncbi:MAG TPA: hypothetical protein VKG92_07200, partial [Flavobacteriales bacterium]|nr:hypothetical protein [Flavobacteriales bacterium]